MNPTRRQYLRLGMGLGVLAAYPSLSTAAASATVQEASSRIVWRERSLTGFGTTLWLRAGDPSADKADAALDRSVQLLRQIESQMSLFDEHSAIRRLNRRGELEKPSRELLQVIGLSSKIAAGSSGAFDISMQPLWELWAHAQAESRLPTGRERRAARDRVNWRAIEASADRILLKKGMSLSLNGIAQGFAADALRAQMQSMGIQHAMLDTGETAVLGMAPGGSPWRFGIEDVQARDAAPAQAATVPDGYALATSSDAHTTFTDDRVHHHILDPRTGDSPGWWSSVTVMARSAALADGLTKVFFMLPPQQVQQAAKRWNVAVILQDKQGRWRRVST
jgi:thiamine biosynthesis lipoprotein